MRGSRPHNPKSDYIVYDDIYFYKERDRGYYLGNVNIPGRKRRYPIRLHVYIWQKHNGPVPKGYHVHHKDENKDNNDISNLELLKAYDHLQLHALKEERINFSKENINTTARPKAIEWHKSEAAKETHKKIYEEHTRAVWMAPVTKTCEICGKEYTVNHASANKSRFCSNNCKATFRRRSGVDNIEYTCPQCGKTYMKYKYSKAKLCSDCQLKNLVESRHQVKARRLASNHPQSKTDDPQSLE